MNKEKFLKGLQEWSPVVSIVSVFISGVFTFFCFIFFDKTNKELSNTKLKIETELLPLEYKNNLKLILYKEVKDVIGQKDSMLQNAAYVIVDEMLVEDPVFQKKLKNILRSLSVTPSKSIRQIQREIDTFREEQSSLTTDKFTIDVFYLEDIIKEAEPRAEDVCSLLRSKYPECLIRKRLLPKVVNAKIGYQIDFNQIRYDVGSKEEKLAREILNEIRERNIFKNEQPILKGINQKEKTENYISIFIRNM